MPEITIDKQNIPLWSGQTGSINVDVNVASLSAPLQPGPNPIVKASFNVNGNKDISLGSATSVSIGVKAGTSFVLAPLWKDNIQADPDVVSQYSLGSALTSKNMLLALQLGANADLSASGSFKYSVLSAGATLDAGVDASFTQVKAYQRSINLSDLLSDFFKNLTLPSDITHPPQAGEVVALEYGGYLKLGLSASAGYELTGTKSFELGQLQLSEHYALSVVGKLGMTAGLAGRFSIEVREGDEAGWAAVTVRRSRTKDFGITADLNVGATLDTQGLPQTGKEFLGAMLGVRAKNWLNLVNNVTDQAGKITSLDTLKASLDHLADDFISKYTGKAVDQLLPAEGAALLGRLQKVVDSYNNLDQSAIALFDRYFDPVLDKTNELESRLTDLSKLISWDSLKGEVDPMLWNIVSQITGGDPLNWILGFLPGTNTPSLPEFLKRVNDGLALIQNDAHDEIRNVISLAKTSFGLDHFFSLLGSIDTVDKLKNSLALEGQHFVERLINKELDKLNSKDLKAAVDIVQKVVKATDIFWSKFDAALKAAASQSFSLGMNAAYSNSSEADALIDLEIRLLDDVGVPVASGQRLMGLAGRGDFQEILANYQPDIVRLHKGTLTHNSTASTNIKINIAGWHLNFQYEEMYKVIVQAEQQIVPTDAGMLNVFTNIDLTNDKDVKRNQSDLHTKFVLTFLGETHNAGATGKFDPRTLSYLIDVITGQSASYQVTFTDSNTTPDELHEALAFASTLGLSARGLTEAGLSPVLDLANGSYGPITATYNVRFAEPGLKALFTEPRPNVAKDIRGILTRITIANYYDKGNIADVAWLYASDDAQTLYKANGPNFVNADSILGDALDSGDVKATSTIPGVQPGSVSNTVAIRAFAAQLFDIEDHMVKAFTALRGVLTAPGPIKLTDLQAAVKEFGNVLKSFEQDTLGENTTFAVFDGLIQLATPAATARSSSLGLTTAKDGQQHQLNFVSPSAQAVAAVGGA